MVSDLTKDISRKYDVLVEEEGVALRYVLWLLKIRGLFIIDREGILRVKHINDFPLGRSVDEALRLVEAIRYADDHGEGNNDLIVIFKSVQQTGSVAKEQ